MQLVTPAIGLMFWTIVIFNRYGFILHNNNDHHFNQIQCYLQFHLLYVSR